MNELGRQREPSSPRAGSGQPWLAPSERPPFMQWHRAAPKYQSWPRRSHKWREGAPLEWAQPNRKKRAARRGLGARGIQVATRRPLIRFALASTSTSSCGRSMRLLGGARRRVNRLCKRPGDSAPAKGQLRPSTALELQFKAAV